MKILLEGKGHSRERGKNELISHLRRPGGGKVRGNALRFCNPHPGKLAALTCLLTCVLRTRASAAMRGLSCRRASAFAVGPSASARLQFCVRY